MVPAYKFSFGPIYRMDQYWQKQEQNKMGSVELEKLKWGINNYVHLFPHLMQFHEIVTYKWAFLDQKIKENDLMILTNRKDGLAWDSTKIQKKWIDLL